MATRRFARDRAMLRWVAADRLARPFVGDLSRPQARSWVHSIREWLYRPELRCRLTELVERSPAVIETYQFPDELPPHFCRTKAFDPQYAYRMTDLVTSPWSGLTWIAGGPILQESFGDPFRAFGWDLRVPEVLIKPQDSVDVPVVPFPDTGYYHWLHEVVPAAVWALARWPDVNILVADDARAYVHQAARLIAPDRTLVVGGVVATSEVIVPGLEPLAGYVRKSDLAATASAIPSCRPGMDRVVFVSRLSDRYSRHRTSVRRLAGEADAEAETAKLGGRVVVAQGMPLQEQVDLFAGAQVLVGVHGAGLGNMAWSKNLRAVVEIFPSAYVNDVYARMAMNLGARYFPLFTQPEPGLAGRIDIAALGEAVSQWSTGPGVA